MLRFFTILFLSLSSFSNIWSQNLPFLSEASRECSLSPEDISEFRVASDYTDRKAGFRVVWLRQLHQGIEIHGADMQLLISKEGKLINQQCGFVKGAHSKLSTISVKSPLEILQIALKSENIDSKITAPIEAGLNKWKLEIPGLINGEMVIVKEYYLQKDGSMPLVYTTRFSPPQSRAFWQVRIDASSGEIVERKNLSVSCSAHGPSGNHSSCNHESDETEQSSAALSDGASYTVFPYPFGSPLDGSRSLVTNPANADASPFGWHDMDGEEGPDNTETIGNNVSAYDDQDDDNEPDGFVDGGAPLNFNFPFTPAPSSTPLDNRDAAITNLFYWNNIVHDFLWHYGFDEPSGNFQNFNYTGLDGAFDGVSAEAFDGSGTNNANFATPPDGEAPRMQMYLWSNNEDLFLSINSPSLIAGEYTAAVAGFGPQTSDPISAQMVILTDGTTNTLGCETANVDLTGKIAIVRRGTCSFVSKVLNAQEAGALAVIVVNNTIDDIINMGGNSDDWQVTIPSVMISETEGNAFFNVLNGGNVVNATLNINQLGDYFDSSFDAGIIAHEYGHGVSNRLTGGPLNVECLYNAEQMGEGWSDFMTLIFSATSLSNPAEPRAVGNYVIGEPNSGPGIRPYPYTTDMNINPATYSFIENNGQTHSVGFTWCTMLWDLYWNMVEEHGYDDDFINGTGGNNMAIKLVMDGMRLQICNPGFVDGRDAILEADAINFGGVNRCLIWESFARRGLGYFADQGDPESTTDGTESFEMPPFCSETDFANFSSNAVTVCKENSITYTDITEPASLSRTWTFEGGTPSTSTSAEVTVNYVVPGTYDVTLNVTNDLGSDEQLRSNFITVGAGISLNFTVGDASATSNNGFIFLSPSGGVTPYETDWEDFPGVNDLTLNFLEPGDYPVTITDQAGCSFDTVFTVERQVGIAAIDADAISVFPNPVKDELRLIVSGANTLKSVNITDAAGRIVLTVIVSGAADNYQINTANLSPGVYFLNLRLASDDLVVRRFVKM